jgi:hypothetical protein
MINNKKVCICIPVGRKRYLEILVNYLLKQKDVVDEIRLWVNTKNSQDLEYIHSLKNIDPIFTYDYSSRGDEWEGDSRAISLFFKNCCDLNTVYLRLDDDIVYLGNNFIEDIINVRLQNPEYFLVFGNIINNAICDYIHKEIGAHKCQEELTFFNGCSVGWGSEEFALKKHINFFRNINNLNIFNFENKVLEPEHGFSINCISWLGEEFAKFNGNVEYMCEERWLSITKPSELNKKNLIFGGNVCVHYSFWNQRNFLSQFNILDQYKLLSDAI